MVYAKKIISGGGRLCGCLSNISMSRGCPIFAKICVMRTKVKKSNCPNVGDMMRRLGTRFPKGCIFLGTDSLVTASHRCFRDMRTPCGRLDVPKHVRTRSFSGNNRKINFCSASGDGRKKGCQARPNSFIKVKRNKAKCCIN